MAIELRILSGRRLGERLTFDQHVVTIGDDLDQDVSFAVRQYAGARNKRARLVADDSGWHLHNDGEGAWIVNQTLVAADADCPLRSGDIIRLSAWGPDLRFALVSPKDEAEAE